LNLQVQRVSEGGATPSTGVEVDVGDHGSVIVEAGGFQAPGCEATPHSGPPVVLGLGLGLDPASDALTLTQEAPASSLSHLAQRPPVPVDDDVTPDPIFDTGPGSVFELDDSDMAFIANALAVDVGATGAVVTPF